VGFGVGPTRNRVNAIEVWRPGERDTVRCRDVDVFGLAALEVVRRLRRYIDLALWRPFAADDDPAEEQGYYFQSALVAANHQPTTPHPTQRAASNRRGLN
jgi:hypothetical protein